MKYPRTPEEERSDRISDTIAAIILGTIVFLAFINPLINLVGGYLERVNY